MKTALALCLLATVASADGPPRGGFVPEKPAPLQIAVYDDASLTVADGKVAAKAGDADACGLAPASETGPKCLGVLLRPDLVLTAASCVVKDGNARRCAKVSFMTAAGAFPRAADTVRPCAGIERAELDERSDYALVKLGAPLAGAGVAALGGTSIDRWARRKDAPPPSAELEAEVYPTWKAAANDYVNANVKLEVRKGKVLIKGMAPEFPGYAGSAVFGGEGVLGVRSCGGMVTLLPLKAKAAVLGR